MLAYVFPGQGAQTTGMGKDLAETYPEAKQVFEEADEALGFSISKLCFEGPDDELRRTEFSQPALLTTSIAALRVLDKETQLIPNYLAGHSLGEYSALVAAGAISFADAVRTVHARGRFMQEAVPEGEGTMAAVIGISAEDVEAICREAAGDQIVSAAVYNAAIQTAIAGHTAAIERASELAKKRSATVKLLEVSAPFHCALMEPAATRLAETLANIEISAPSIPIVANVDAAPNQDPSRVVTLLIEQMTAPVRWDASVRRLIELGVNVTFELGVGDRLTRLIKSIDKSVDATNITDAIDVEVAMERAKFELIEYRDKYREHTWHIRETDGAKVNEDDTFYVWPNGLEWNFDDPNAHGF